MVVALSACISPSSETCADGRVCPVDTVCASLASTQETLCVRQEQLDQCRDLAPRAVCGSDGAGRCYDGVCLPGGCGNGRLDDAASNALDSETCDDGNTLAGDGCSAVCLVETCGNGAIDPVLGEECDDGVAGISGDGCSSTCKLEIRTWRDVSPTPITARIGVALAYDAGRGRLIGFGGLGTAQLYSETWTWTQTQWVRLSPAVAPPPRFNHSLVYDSARQRVVLFGGTGVAGPLGDTWEWDGVTWIERTPAVAPKARHSAQLGYDIGRQRVVLYGGGMAAPYDNATWEWDGAAWTKLDVSGPATFPTVPMAYDGVGKRLLACARVGSDNLCHTWTWNGVAWSEVTTATQRPTITSGHRMAFDESRDRLVLFGGSSNDVWEWAGTNWVVATATTKPAARSDMGLAFDGKQILMFGGRTASGQVLGDTWQWSEVGWTQLSPTAGPAARYGAASAFDPLRGRAILMGGRVSTVPSPETWEWSRTGWRQLNNAASITGRTGAAMDFDLARARFVLFGGSDGTNVLGDTWQLTGTVWQAANPAVSPGPRSGASMAFDAARATTILFGGFDGDAALGDTWAFDGTTWMDVSQAGGPSPRYDAAIAYDPLRERIVMFGGRTAQNQPTGETWEWDGASWMQRGSAQAPAARQEASMTYDPLIRRVVLSGGRDGTAGEIFGDLWEWDGTTWTPVNAQQQPARRLGASMFFDPWLRGVVMFGGRLAVADSKETLLLEYHGIHPTEACGLDTEDRDGDTLAGCRDPDCWGRCAPLCPPGHSCAAEPTCGDGTCTSFLEDYLICPADCPSP